MQEWAVKMTEDIQNEFHIQLPDSILSNISSSNVDSSSRLLALEELKNSVEDKTVREVNMYIMIILRNDYAFIYLCDCVVDDCP